jgi:hypothetical protein
MKEKSECDLCDYREGDQCIISQLELSWYRHGEIPCPLEGEFDSVEMEIR